MRLIAMGIFLSAVLSDAIDGFIARIAAQKTPLGAFLDPLADKLLLVSSFICLSLINNLPAQIKFPAWVAVIVITRDLIIMVGTLVIYLITGKLKITPSIWGKATTFFQMLAIFSVLLQYRHSFYIWDTAVVLTVISGIDYVLKGTRFLNGSTKQ